jgi:hypothetical protein
MVGQRVLNELYRGHDFLAVVLFDSAPRPPLFPPSSVSKLPLCLCLPVCRRSSLITGGGVKANHTAARKLGPLLIVQSFLVLVTSLVDTHTR